MKKLVLVLPAFNEAEVINEVIFNLEEKTKYLISFDKKIVIIDDGSKEYLSKIIPSKKGIVILRHIINCGLGSALSTGLEYAKIENADYAVTFDADGQHDARDVSKVLSPLLVNESDVVIGTRNIYKMPFDRQIITILSSILTFIFFGQYCSDTQSGLRAFNKTALRKICLKTQRMEVSSEFFREIKRNKLRLKEVPIRVIYTPYSRRKGQKNSNALEILVKLILRLFR